MILRRSDQGANYNGEEAAHLTRTGRWLVSGNACRGCYRYPCISSRRLRMSCATRRLKLPDVLPPAAATPHFFTRCGGTGTTRLDGVKSLQSDEPDDTEAVPDSEAQFLSTA
jgi:hypothetical protein